MFLRWTFKNLERICIVSSIICILTLIFPFVYIPSLESEVVCQNEKEKMVETYDPLSSLDFVRDDSITSILDSYNSYIPVTEPSQYDPEGEDLLEEFKMDDMEMLAQLVQAEAGNQDLTGKRLVADCVLNRIDSAKFIDQNDVYDVIYADKQFSVMTNGAFDKAGWEITDECFQAVEMEWQRESRLDQNVIYFNGVHENGKNPFKYGDHWFSY